MSTSRTSTLIAAVLLAVAMPATAKVQTQEVEYKQGDTALQGFFAWDDAAKGKRPGVLVIHEWWGHNEHARNQARRLAKAGYVAFALDMYGKGILAKHPSDAESFMKEATKDPAIVGARFEAGLAKLKAHPNVDPEKIAVFGYCFGGGVALGMARAGEDVDAVVTFHGALDTSKTTEKGKVKAKVLVLTGGADPMLPAEKVQAFEKDMKAAGADIRVVTYPGAKHSFTNPDANKAGMDELKYDANADQKSWAEAMKFLKQVFGT